MAEMELAPSLRVVAVKGTSARSPAHFALKDNVLAYTAGGGIVVSHLDTNAQIQSQRIYVANSVVDGGSTNSLSQTFFDLSREQDQKRDAYGFPISPIPVTYDGSGKDGNEPLKTRSSFESSESPSGSSSAKMKDKVRAVSCLALSPNKKLLAVGESGYRPRILLYSLAPDATGSPFAVIHEHNFGVRHLAFSPDSKYFCSLGNISDGFLHVWKYSANAISLKAGNKCSSVINDLIWHDNGSEYGQIIALGLRFLKCWTYEPSESNGSKISVLKGRPTVLGKYLPLNFKEASSVNTDEILLTDGNILFVYSPEASTLVPVLYQPSGLNGLSINFSSQKVYYFDDSSEFHTLHLSDLKVIADPQLPSSPTRSPGELSRNLLNLSVTADSGPSKVIKAFTYDDENLLYLTNHETICIFNKQKETSHSAIGAPNKALTGMKRSTSGDILVFSKDGDVSLLLPDNTFQNLFNHTLPKVETIANELTAVEYFKDYLFIGDKFGQLTICDRTDNSWKTVFQLKAHASTINHLASFEVGKYIGLCSISRDRMIQLFVCNEGSWSLLQTLPTHNGNLLDVRISASNLFVCSADRTVSIHELKEVPDQSGQETISVTQKRILILKSTPLAMSLSSSELYVSTNDKSIIVYDLSSLEQKRVLKPYTDKHNESLNAEDFLLLPKTLIAIASSDRSLRLFNSVSGKHVSVGWGHSEPILGLIERDDSILSLGADGCLFEWIIDSNSNETLGTHLDSPSKDTTPEASPLYGKVARKIIPTPQSSTYSLSPRRQPKFDENLPSEPESPTPKLTSATLKRLEAKRLSAGTYGTTSKTSPSSSIRTQRLPYSSTNSSSIARAALRSPSPKVSLERGSPSSQKKSPFASPSSRRSTFAPKAVSPLRLSQPSQTNDTPSFSNLESTNFAAPSLPPPSHAQESDALERALAYLAIIKSHVEKHVFSQTEQQRLQAEMKGIMNILGTHNTRSEEDILEDYSSKLLALMAQKISK
ncbi:WD domain, G-beta repeat family protein [Clavispora lusitaniae]|uniref:Uncharacterized protein n=1 Tax=Clavispora lusitaniae (strain ATCC 42720) TaxID=306902 RepID=C4YB38_CLAL4|nr:uncharacterized protein CLUG_05330 [Clavispora lusitaniae ATCC 42720]EEQ41202.1 hypothetical protein CLUG_05330 [Clavispora lusitaniae ATCC 42720]KAF7581297.1 WD domain, G-beta repeat family protein [Clavispora lusitaniae]